MPAGLGQHTAGNARRGARAQETRPGLSGGINLRRECRCGAPRGERARSAAGWQHPIAWRAPRPKHLQAATSESVAWLGFGAPVGAPPPFISGRSLNCLAECLGRQRAARTRRLVWKFAGPAPANRQWRTANDRTNKRLHCTPLMWNASKFFTVEALGIVAPVPIVAPRELRRRRQASRRSEQRGGDTRLNSVGA